MEDGRIDPNNREQQTDGRRDKRFSSSMTEYKEWLLRCPAYSSYFVLTVSAALRAQLEKKGLRSIVIPRCQDPAAPAVKLHSLGQYWQHRRRGSKGLTVFDVVYP